MLFLLSLKTCRIYPFLISRIVIRGFALTNLEIYYTIKGETNGKRSGITLEINGKNAHDLDGLGNNFEKEVLFERDSSFVVKKEKSDSNESENIDVDEVSNDGIDEGSATSQNDRRRGEIQIEGTGRGVSNNSNTGHDKRSGEIRAEQRRSRRTETSALDELVEQAKFEALVMFVGNEITEKQFNVLDGKYSEDERGYCKRRRNRV